MINNEINRIDEFHFAFIDCRVLNPMISQNADKNPMGFVFQVSSITNLRRR